MAKRSFYKQTANVEAASTATVLEVDKPSRFTQTVPQQNILPKTAPWGWWIILNGILVLLMIFAGMLYTGWNYYQAFTQAAGHDVKDLVKTVWNARSVNPFHNKKAYTILFIGIDQSKHLRENSLLTDTIALVSINENGQVRMVSIPRDLWIESLKTKINALYYYGQQSNPNDGVALLSSVMTEITGMEIDYYAIVNMDTVKEMVNAFGGITVNVARSFEDSEYPREIDLNSKDPSVLYETVQFTAGNQTFDGITALKYIRSRHSTDPVEGTDVGREMRQQLVMQALLDRMKDVSLMSNPQTLGKMYAVWKQYVKTNIDEKTMILIGLHLRSKTLQVSQYTVPIKTEDQDGMLFHPKEGPNKQWVYQPVDPTWNSLHSWTKATLIP